MACSFTTTRIVYGTLSPSQFVLLYVPDVPDVETAGDELQFPTVFFVHGGFWLSKYGLDPPTACCETIVDSLISRQIACAFVEYRRSGEERWGWPATNADIVHAYEAVISNRSVNSDRIAVIGHSAGGALGLWLASQLAHQPGLHTDSVSSCPRVDTRTLVPPKLTIGLAPVSDLAMAAQLRLSDDGNAVQRYMHVPDDVSAAHFFKPACPTAQAHTLAFARVTLMLGDRDDIIPEQVVKSTFDALTAIRAGLPDDVRLNLPALRLIQLQDCDHFDIVNAKSVAWQKVVEEIQFVLVPRSQIGSPGNDAITSRC